LAKMAIFPRTKKRTTRKRTKSDFTSRDTGIFFSAVLHLNP
jgi:hypothetical protein